MKKILQQHYGKIGIVVTALLVLGFDGIKSNKFLSIFLPGTQVGTVESAESAQICGQCHSSPLPERSVPIYREWSGSMMAQAARDPIFYAALAVANKYRATSGEFCIRCHSPSGWLAGHSEDFTGRALTGTDFDGVQCDYCHRVGDPLHPDSTLSMVTNYRVPGYGNGMHGVQRTRFPKRGPYDSLAAPHDTRYDSFQETSELCGVCHDVSNPFYAQDQIQQAPFEYAPIERTYSEWAESWYATQGDSGTCQSCHMISSPGFVCIYPSSFRSDVAKHDLTGGNTFVPDILQDFWPGLDSSTLAEGKQRAINTLQRAANLAIQTSRIADTVFTRVRVTNLTGHKLPTGYPEGRRMWIELVARTSQGDTVFHSGKYDPSSATLIRDSYIKVYEAVHGITDSLSLETGIPKGVSFHFIMNDTILSDNRIPPKGFKNAAFELRNAQPVGVAYADNQYWDETDYALPSSTTEVIASLHYQTISKEYIEFLRSENAGNIFDWNLWGEKLFTAWELKGKSQPIAMVATTVQTPPTAVSEMDKRLPRATALLANFPNPFNPSTTIEFQISTNAFVTLTIYDINGKEITTLEKERKPPGTYSISFNASPLPSGIYFYSLTADNFRQTKKMLLIK